MNLFDRAVALFEADYAKAEEWFTGTALPFLKTFLTQTVEEELAALEPIIVAAIPTVIMDLGAISNPLGWGTAVMSVINVVVPELEAKGLQVANASLHTAVGAALANVQAAFVAAQPNTPA